MKGQFAQRMASVQKSFLREILEVARRPGIISFAGGLPNPNYFPIEGIRTAADKVLATAGADALQYAPTMGYLPLREFIAQRYEEKIGLTVHPDEILITSGSQQGLDLVGKILLDKGDVVLVENPSYLGGLMALRLYEPEFVTVPMEDDGVDTAVLQQRAQDNNVKLFYALPNFQNPTGISYSLEKRQKTAEIMRDTHTFFIEDDPYSELRFTGESLPLIANTYRETGFVLGSFSKIVSPGMRLGWTVAPPPLMDNLVIAKQGSDLHTNYFAQRILHQFLIDNELDAHINTLRSVYHEQRELMISIIEETFPDEIDCLVPDGGMFLWLTLPKGMSAMELFKIAIEQNVLFVPGAPFYPDAGVENTLRLNFSNTNKANIEEGMTRLAKAVRQAMGK